jgi:hypothetical protein
MKLEDAPAPLGLAAPPVKPEQPNLKEQITLLITELDRHIQQPVAISLLSTRFTINTRRLSDIINILSALGCCRRSGLAHLIWMGRAQIPAFVSELRRLRDVDNADRTLCDLFPASDCVGMSNLTSCFLLVFHALRTNRLDLHSVAQLFSWKTPRYKSTLCKLYQIVLVLCAAGICSRTSQACEVMLLHGYIDFPVGPAEQSTDPGGPLGIDSLLNRKKATADADFILRRRKELHDLFASNVVSKAVLSSDDN